MSPLQFLLAFLKQISVEPGTLLVMTGVNVFSISNDVGMYRLMCDQMFNTNGGSQLNNYSYFECWDMKKSLGSDLHHQNGTEWWSRAEIKLQQETTSISMIGSLTLLLPSLITNIILGAYADRKGRKPVLLLGYLGAIISMIPFPFLYASPKTAPIYVIYIANIISSLLGGVAGIGTTSAAYLSDTIHNAESLTIRMTILQMTMNMGFIIGPELGTILSEAIGYIWTFVVVIGMVTAAMLSTLILVKWVKPKQRDGNMPDGKESDQNEGEVESGRKIGQAMPVPMETPVDQSNSKQGFVGELVSIVKSVPSLLAECWKSVSKPRSGNKRAYVLIAVYSSFIYMAVDFATLGTVFTLYVQKAPIGWRQEQVSFYRSICNVIRVLGITAGVFILRKCLRLSSALIIVLALLSMTGQIVLIAFANNSYMLYLAGAVGALGSLQQPCTQALLAEIVEPNEVGKIYAAVGLSTGLAILFSFDVIGAIYQATVATFPTLVFFVCAAMLSTAVITSSWLHLDYSKEKGGWCTRRMCSCCGKREECSVS